jgi:predicted DNA-binding transcriptional regulator AlpA
MIGFPTHFAYHVDVKLNNRRNGWFTMDEQFEFPDTNRLLTADEVSRILIYSRSTAYRLMNKQKIRTVHMSGTRRVWLNDLKKFIEDEKMSSKKKKKY